MARPSRPIRPRSPPAGPKPARPAPSARHDPDLALPDGPGAAAILAAGVGSLALGLFALAGDASPAIKHAFNVWAPTGALSGVTTAAILVWLATWYGLSRRWARRNVDFARINLAALAMLFAGLLLTFPPFMDLLQGK
jgi:hypothetical protein